MVRSSSPPTPWYCQDLITKPYVLQPFFLQPLCVRLPSFSSPRRTISLPIVVEPFQQIVTTSSHHFLDLLQVLKQVEASQPYICSLNNLQRGSTRGTPRGLSILNVYALYYSSQLSIFKTSLQVRPARAYVRAKPDQGEKCGTASVSFVTYIIPAYYSSRIILLH